MAISRWSVCSGSDWLARTVGLSSGGLKLWSPGIGNGESERKQGEGKGREEKGREGMSKLIVKTLINLWKICARSIWRRRKIRMEAATWGPVFRVLSSQAMTIKAAPIRGRFPLYIDSLKRRSHCVRRPAYTQPRRPTQLVDVKCVVPPAPKHSQCQCQCHCCLKRERSQTWWR